MNSSLKKILQNGWSELAVRWFLGIIFITASYYKIVSPEHFAKAIYGYDLFPDYSINLIAIIFPYMECLSGICLILGIYRRGAVLLVNAMIAGFIIILSVNLARGHQFDCGCFGYNGSGAADSVSGLLFRNVILFLLASYVLNYKGYRRWCFTRTIR